MTRANLSYANLTNTKLSLTQLNEAGAFMDCYSLIAKPHQQRNHARRQPSWASSSVFAQIPLRSTHGTYRGPTLVSVTASLAAIAIRARRLGVLEPWWRMINRSWFGADLKKLAGAVEERGA